MNVLTSHSWSSSEQMSNRAAISREPEARVETERTRVGFKESEGRLSVKNLISSLINHLLYQWSRLQRLLRLTRSSTSDYGKDHIVVPHASRTTHHKWASGGTLHYVPNSSSAYHGYDPTRKIQPLFPHRQFKDSIHHHRSKPSARKVRSKWLPGVERIDRCQVFKAKGGNRNRGSWVALQTTHASPDTVTVPCHKLMHKVLMPSTLRLRPDCSQLEPELFR